MKQTGSIKLNAGATGIRIEFSAALAIWLEMKRQQFESVPILALLAKIVGIDVRITDQEIDEAVEYMQRVTGDVLNDSARATGAILNSLYAVFAPSRLSDTMQRRLWNGPRFANRAQLVEMLNGFCSTRFTIEGTDITVTGGQILAECFSSAGVAEAKNGAAIAAIASVKGLNEQAVSDIVRQLPVEGATIDHLQPDVQAILAVGIRVQASTGASAS